MQMRSTSGRLFALNLHKLTSSQSRTRDTSFLLHHVTIDPTPRDDVHLLVAVDVINVKADVSVFREEFPSEWMKTWTFQVAKQIQRPFIYSVSTCGAMATFVVNCYRIKTKKALSDRCATDWMKRFFKEQPPIKWNPLRRVRFTSKTSSATSFPTANGSRCLKTCTQAVPDSSNLHNFRDLELGI